MKITSENEAVFYIDEEKRLLQRKDFNFLIEIALKNDRHRARLCAHENIESDLHDIFDVFTKDTYLRPLKQERKIYSYHVIQGEADVYLFSEAGAVTDIIPLGDFQSGKSCFFRLPVGVYRTLVPQSDIFIYHEVTTGPFVKENTIFASWAPDESEHDKVQSYISFLKGLK